jgi:hypothetical protein
MKKRAFYFNGHSRIFHSHKKPDPIHLFLGIYPSPTLIPTNRLEAKIKESGGDQPCTPLKKLKSGVDCPHLPFVIIIEKSAKLTFLYSPTEQLALSLSFPSQLPNITPYMINGK